MKVLLAQVDPIVGDITGNAARICRVSRDAAAQNAELVIFPELSLVGYPPRDLLDRASFLDNVEAAVAEIVAFSVEIPKTGILFGAPLSTGGANGRGLHNVALLVCNGEIVGKAVKRLLPVYDVFDEERYFDPATDVEPIPFRGELLGVHICEDAWTEYSIWSRRRNYGVDPVAILAEKGATILINLSASPFCTGKEAVRFQLMSDHARRHGLPFLYVNQVGGNDELVFDGRSLFLDRRGNPAEVLVAFAEEMRLIDTDTMANGAAYEPIDETASVHDALILGLRDYMHKVGFHKAVVGLSGGIDSSLTFYLAVQALGKENVLGVSMPSQYSSSGSVEDSRQLAKNLGAPFRIIAIEPTYDRYIEALADVFADTEPNVAEENIQARIRGNILMAISNKFGSMVLSTGNKSELAVGYCTLYGDMSGDWRSSLTSQKAWCTGSQSMQTATAS